MRVPTPSLRRLPWWADVVLGALVLVGYTVELVAWHAPHLPATLGAAALSGVGLSLRRSSPVVGALLAFVSTDLVTRLAPGFDNDSGTLVVVFFLTLWSLGRHTAGTERWVGAALVLLNVVRFVVGDAGGRQIDPGDVAFSVVFVGAPWLAGVTMRIRHDREQSWRARNEQLRAEQEERERRAVTAERSRIARELHDVVSHAIAVTVLQARGARRQLGRDEAAVRRALDAIDHTNTQALGDMRRLLALLRDTEDSPIGAPQPTLERLPALVDDLRDSGLPVDLRVRGDAAAVPPGVELSAYRIVQEALTNVLKHAGSGATATVDLAYGDGALELCVRDDGRGADGDGRPGHGLVGIRARVAVVGGQVTTGPRAEGGFAVSVRLPYAVEV
jgi:signal transduction histidine kinase